MKIAYLLGSLNRGGTETLLLDVFHKAVTAPFEMIGIYRKTGVLEKAFCESKVSMYHLFPQKGKLLIYLYRLRKLLQQEQVDVVHTQQFLDAVYASLATIGTKIQIVETFHGYDFDASKTSRFLIKLSIIFCKAVYFVSEEQKIYFERRYALKKTAKCKVVYDGVNFDKLGDVPNNKSPQATLTFGTVGNFVRVREQNTICRFLKLLYNKGVDFQFFFVGKRNDLEPWRYDNCLKYCKENNLQSCVHFLGSRSDVPQLLQTWDAFIYSTDHDTFGIAVVEAIASGLPTFVNDWSVMREVTHNGELAILYKTKDADDLCEKFMPFLQEKESYMKQSLLNAKKIRCLYGIDQHINCLFAQYKQVLDIQ